MQGFIFLRGTNKFQKPGAGCGSAWRRARGRGRKLPITDAQIAEMEGATLGEINYAGRRGPGEKRTRHDVMSPRVRIRPAMPAGKSPSSHLGGDQLLRRRTNTDIIVHEAGGWSFFARQGAEGDPAAARFSPSSIRAVPALAYTAHAARPSPTHRGASARRFG